MVRRGRTGPVVALVIALAMIGTSCQWTLARFDAGNSNVNRGETTLSVANVGGLHQEWTTAGLGPVASQLSPIVYDAKVFVSSGSGLAAFDAGGSIGCGGTPKTCAPLWTAPEWGGQPFAYDGRLYAFGRDGLGAFDPDGVTGCSGSPHVCAPLSTASLGIYPVLPAGGELFGLARGGPTGLGEIVAFDDDVLAGCVGPCARARTYQTSCPEGAEYCEPMDIAVAGDDLVVTTRHRFFGYWEGTVAGYDRAGVRGCSGVPVTCAPLWTSWSGFGSVALGDGAAVAPWGDIGSVYDEFPPGYGLHVFDQSDGAFRWSGAVPFGEIGAVAVGQGWVHLRTSTQVSSYPLATSCTSSCPPHHVANLTGSALTDPKVANGVMYVGTTAGLQAFDAAGVAGCSGVPIACAPLVTAAPAGVSIGSVSIALGKVWSIGSDQQLRVYGLA